MSPKTLSLAIPPTRIFGGPMKPLAFKLAVRRDVVGSRIDVTVNTEPDRLIDRIKTALDNLDWRTTT